MRRVMIELTEREYRLLKQAAEADFRAIKAQAQMALREYLNRRFAPTLKVVGQ